MKHRYPLHLLRLVFLLTLTMSLSNRSSAQTPGTPMGVPVTPTGYGAVKSFTPSSPEMTAMQRYGDVPVSYNTGVPNIQIPLGELALKGFSWPIGLSYHAGGNKVEDFASSVGLGWTLGAGGFISTKVGGGGGQSVDRFMNLTTKVDYRQGFVSVCGPNGDNFTNLADIMEAENLIATGGLSKPDIFYLNTPSLSARFMQRDQQYFTVPVTDARIWSENGPDGHLVFYALDTQGNRYTFAKQAVSSSNMPGGALSLNPTYALTRVDTYLGEHLTFAYDTVSHHYRTQGQEMRQRMSDDNCEPCRTKLPKEYSQLNDLGYAHAVELVITEIVASNGKKVVFQYASRLDVQERERLEKVIFKEMRGGYYATLQEYELLAGYFGSGTAQTGNLRLKLTGLKKSGAQLPGLRHAAQEEYHQFEYDATQLPPRLSYDIDSMGFYNGGNGNASLLPSQSFRSSSFHNTKASVLEKITYPTGGSTSFAYELNTGGWGGLRVREIKDLDADGTVLKRRSFVYEEGSVNFVPFTAHTYFSFISETGTDCNLETTWSGGGLYRCPVIKEQSTPTYSLSAYFENSLGYCRVTEYLDGPDAGGQGLGGKTVYRYNTHIDYKGRTAVLNIPSTLTSKETFRRLPGGGYALVQSEDSFYEVPVDSGPNNSAIDSVYFSQPDGPRDVRLFYKEIEEVRPDMELVFEGTPDEPGLKFFVCFPRVYLQRDYRLDLVPLYLTKTVSRSYPDTATVPMKAETVYAYEPELVQPSAVSRLQSDSTVVTEYTKYSNSPVLPAGYSPAEQAAVQGLVAANVITPLWQRTEVGGVPTYERQVFYGAFPVPGQPSESKYHARRETLSPTGGPERRQMEVVAYDAQWNPVEILEDGVKRVSSVYTPRGEVAAQCADASHGEIAFSSFNGIGGSGFTVGAQPSYSTDAFASGSSLSMNGQSLSKQGLTAGKAYVLAGYRKGGAVSLSGGTATATRVGPPLPGGWEYFETEFTAGGASMTVTGAGLLDELRLHPRGTHMASFVYGDAIGMVTAKTDPNGLTVFFEYDAQGRLKLARDRQGNILKHYEYHLKEQAQ
ncbi:RHS repeat domain-containing protein [Rufibacter sp. LB8]|uniref:RHS repeat domain-containing protein n=1 Tax=Rufibacter sp. LB8 TaxID=2777781 RepID=UPI00178C3846|nr:RHS repeat domain-containing protein [Rufibacter sp. LB8]